MKPSSRRPQMPSDRKDRSANSPLRVKSILLYCLGGLVLGYLALVVALARYAASNVAHHKHGEAVSLHHVMNTNQRLKDWEKRLNVVPKIQEWAHNVDPQQLQISKPKIVTLEHGEQPKPPARQREIPKNMQLQQQPPPPPRNDEQPKQLSAGDAHHGLEENLEHPDDRQKAQSGPQGGDNARASVPLMLTAYMEELRLEEWETKPLPIRSKTTAQAEHLQKRQYPQVNSCQRLPQQWPVNCYDADDVDEDKSAPVIRDPFLPWIHDVFPTADGASIQFVAQNHRRCHTGSTPSEQAILEQQQPQAALFQHVAVKRVETGGADQHRYRLASHEDADADGVETRFICHFKDSHGNTIGETLSFFNSDYEYASYRKRHKNVFTKEGRDNKRIHTSQLIFQCPVPTNVDVTRADGTHTTLQHLIRTGGSVDPTSDRALYYVDIVPIRTPPRYGKPNSFFPPYYSEFQLPPIDSRTGQPDADYFNATEEWGSQHILPKRTDSGRWENIPICKPSTLTYGDDESIASAQQYVNEQSVTSITDPPPVDLRVTRPNNILKDKVSPSKPTLKPQKQHRLISCLWASTGYATRGNRFAINDGQRRLLEFMSYYDLIGVDHFYVYDNSGAFGNQAIDDDPSPSLKEITDLFPSTKVTWINWPSKICNNNPNNVDSVGERSSQYAAESSCRLRFGPHTDWIGQFDLDEYLVPMGSYSNANPQLLDTLERQGNTIASFGSWRAWPRRKFVEDPNASRLSGAEHCGIAKWDCFQLHIPMNQTILQSYNCDRQPPGKKKQKMPAEKQLYRPDYVKQHYIHYSTITALSELNRQELKAYGPKERSEWRQGGSFPDPLSRFGDEVTEGLMLHTKAVATQDTGGWETVCKTGYVGQALCRLGNPYPEGEAAKHVNLNDGDSNGHSYNCYVNHKIDDFYVPKLEDRLKQFVPEIAQKLQQREQGGV